MTKRKSENGLNFYGFDSIDKEKYGDAWYYNEVYVKTYEERTGIKLPNTAENNGNVIAECESGWDFSPRFSNRALQYNPVDLNSLLYADERLLSEWAEKLGDEENAFFYAEAARSRKEKMLRWMKKDGIYYDYNFVEGRCSRVVSCAAFYPHFVGLDGDRYGFNKTLAELETEFGVMACRWDKLGFQWAEPNGWSPLNYVAIAAAERLGETETAKRLAEKFLNATERIYQKTGRLWEKYNAKTGELDVSSEYGTPEMLGWTAGVYTALYEYQKKGWKSLI